MSELRRLFPRGVSAKPAGHDKDERLFQLLNLALVQRIDGNEGAMTQTLLTAIEVAYGPLGTMPSNLAALVDDLNSVRRTIGTALPPERPGA